MHNTTHTTAHTTTKEERRSEFATALREDHAALFTALEDLLFDEKSAPAALRDAWPAFAAALHAHLTAEEELLIPGFELVGPAEAARIRCEHRQIRQQLEEIERELGQDVVDRERMARLLGTLRVSAAQKEDGLYAWAEHALRPRSKARMVEYLRANRQARAGGST